MTKRDQQAMREESKFEIPEKYQKLCKDIAKVLVEFQSENYNNKSYDGVYRFTGKFQPAGMKDWGEVSFTWESGRHNDSVGFITIRSEIRIDTKIECND